MNLPELDKEINGSMVMKDLGRVALKGNTARAERRAVFKCNFCGSHFDTSVQSVKSGATTSCGCEQRRIMSERMTTHGKSKTRAFKIWQGMINRCHNKNSEFYHRYGGRGISVCDEWKNDFMAFYNSMGDPKPKYTIDRIDNDGNYEPSNCQWITRSENSSKDRKGVKVSPMWDRADELRDYVDRHSARRAEKEFGVSRKTIRKILDDARQH